MHYPEPPQGVYTSAPIDFDSYNSYTRGSQDFATAMGFDGNPALTADGRRYVYPGSSPGMYAADDSDMPAAASNMSTTSASSSNLGSPLSMHGQLPSHDWSGRHILGMSPNIVDQHECYPQGNEYSIAAGTVDGYHAAFEYATAKPSFVDPSILHPEVGPLAMPQYSQDTFRASPYPPHSPALSSPQVRTGSTSPFMHNGNFQQFSIYPPPVEPQRRRPSFSSYHSNYSGEPTYSGDESKEKQRCPHPDCGKTFKDLKAHMLTHQTERPEKCPIATCEYHVKGFARKYDKNRHTLTHYKGTMVCGFCPGSGSAAEKSFNRADVFKRHLTAVHGVEQTPPNSRKKANGGNSTKKLTGYAPDATGKCSTCSQTFSNAQDFYEHLDDCVLRIVQQEDPAEAINARRLAEVEDSPEVHSTLDRNNLAVTTTASTSIIDDMVEDDDPADVEYRGRRTVSTSPKKKTNPASGVPKSRGMTHSRGGVPLASKRSGRKNRRDYPSSWGFDKGQMTMKKRVVTVFDGPRRLAKDDMVLSTEHEVRVKLSNGMSYVTDLDVQTLKRAEGFHGATDEEKGPWISDDPTEEQLKQMLVR